MSMSSTTFTTSVPGSAPHGSHINTKEHNNNSSNNNNSNNSNSNASGLFNSPTRATRGQEGRVGIGAGAGVESRVGTADSRAGGGGGGGGGKSGPSADCNEEKGTTIIPFNSFPMPSIKWNYVVLN